MRPAAAIAVALLSLAPGAPTAATRSTGVTTTPSSAVFPEGILHRAPTRAERRAAVAFVDAARAGLGRWRDPTMASDAGFVAAPGQDLVVHLIRAGWLVTVGTRPDPARPSALVYLRTPAGLRLVGAMWMMAAPGEPGPDFGGPLTPWHAHVDCRGPTGVDVPPAGGPCAPGQSRETSAEMLHVWLPGVPDAYDTAMDPAVLVCAIR